jgi:hypothetical protein
VPRFYRTVGAQEPLAQGDIFIGVPDPDVSFRQPFRLVDQKDGTFLEEEVLGDLEQDMNMVATVDLVNAIILDQSCDTLSADRILLARLVDLDLTSQKSSKEKWDQIKGMGNSLQQPTRV